LAVAAGLMTAIAAAHPARAHPARAQPPSAAAAAAQRDAAGAAENTAPDLLLVALQTAGPGLAGDCNRVVARLQNAGGAATAEAPEVRLDVEGGAPWSRVARAAESLAAGATVEVWFEQVPLHAGVLTVLAATADPGDRIRERDETNNARSVHREPRTRCGADQPSSAPASEVRVRVSRRDASGAPGAPLAGAEVSVSSPLGTGRELARAATTAGGTAVVMLPSDARTPVLRVTATSPGCTPETHLLPSSRATRLPTVDAGDARGAEAASDLDFALDCAGGASEGAAGPGALVIEAALPGYLRLDEEAPRAVRLGERIEEHRPGARVRVRAMSHGGVLFHDTTVDVPRDAGTTIVVDAPPLQPVFGSAVVEDLRTGLVWTVGARTVSSFDDAVATCERLEVGGATDWRLPEIDQLAFVLLARAGAAAGDAAADASAAGAAPAGAAAEGELFPELSDCCLWSATAHSEWRLTFYLDGGHIYGRDPTQSGVGALCVRGEPHAVDPLLVPERYRDRLPGQRRFAPPAPPR
jgi:hypothetical protein